jgi:hypothetical protein
MNSLPSKADWKHFMEMVPALRTIPSKKKFQISFYSY